MMNCNDKLLLAEYGEAMKPLDTLQDYALAKELFKSLYRFKDFSGNLNDLSTHMYGLTVPSSYT